MNTKHDIAMKSDAYKIVELNGALGKYPELSRCATGDIVAFRFSPEMHYEEMLCGQCKMIRNPDTEKEEIIEISEDIWNLLHIDDEADENDDYIRILPINETCMHLWHKPLNNMSDDEWVAETSCEYVRNIREMMVSAHTISEIQLAFDKTLETCIAHEDEINRNEIMGRHGLWAYVRRRKSNKANSKAEKIEIEKIVMQFLIEAKQNCLWT